MDTKNFRKNFKMSQRDFSNFFDVPYGTVKNWDSRSCVPQYFLRLCEKYLALLWGVWCDEKNDLSGTEKTCDDS